MEIPLLSSDRVSNVRDTRNGLQMTVELSEGEEYIVTVVVVSKVAVALVLLAAVPVAVVVVMVAVEVVDILVVGVAVVGVVVEATGVVTAIVVSVLAVTDVVVATVIVKFRFIEAVVVAGKDVLNAVELVFAAAILSIGVNVILVICN